MKIRSIQFKFLATVISAMLVLAIFVGGLSIYEVDQYLQQHTKEFVEINCSNEASQVNDIFGDIENSVRIMESYVLSLARIAPSIKDRNYQNTILRLAGDLFVDIADNTDGAVAYYTRFAPEISDNKAGIFFTKMNGNDEYVELEPTDLSLYDKNDVEHVGWYWQAHDAGHPVWMAPYYNQNNNIFMISFVIPLYFEDQFIGIVGMDFDYTLLTDRVHQIKIFENGFAHLELDGSIIHTGNEEANGDHSHEEDEYLQASEKLANGMTLILFASQSDITKIRYEIGYKIVFTVLLLTLAFTFIVFLIVKKLVKPLKVLTNASTKLSNGDYDIKIEHGTTYEIQQLSTAFENMIVKLQEHKKLQHLLTYRDPLTELRNTTSYKAWIIDFNKKIVNEELSFGVMVLDINYLKETNDTYGHITGNKLIKTASQIISDTFKRSPVFRIGGDEFVVILQNRDLNDRERLFENLDLACANTFVETNDTNISVSIAKGFSMFDPDTDTQFSDVFHRADDEMYKNKKEMKLSSV